MCNHKAKHNKNLEENKMNKQQRAYMAAKAKYDTLEDIAHEIERKYIAEHNIINADGEVPTAIYCIDDEEVFDRANEDTAPELDKLQTWKAREALNAAEDALINYGLSIMPAFYSKEREQLRNSCFGLNGCTFRLKIRNQVIDSTFKLDTRTVPKAIA